MSLDLSLLDAAPRLLFAIALQPMQGQRFQPTGFPGLGAATFRSPAGDCLLVESAQSMANRLEKTVWDDATNDVVEAARGLSHVRIDRPDGSFLTDTILEAHRLNSPYLLEASDKVFFNRLKKELGGLEVGPVDRRKLAAVLLKLDVGSLLHGVFLAKGDLAGGRLRVARALSAFIEADGVQVAASGGVKNDHVHPAKVKGDSKNHFGNIPYPRDDFTAKRITLFVNFDLTQLRGYGLGDDVVKLLVTLGLYKLRTLLHEGLRLRTACDLQVVTVPIIATAPADFELPTAAELRNALRESIERCAGLMEPSVAVFANNLVSEQEKVSKEPNEDFSASDGS